MLVAVAQVDVIKDWLDYANLVVGAGGFAAAIVAIILARRAQQTADEAVTDERRRAFELEILRELTKVIDDEELVYRIFRKPAELRQFRAQLDLLSSTMPFWEQIASSADNPAVIRAVGLGESHHAAQARADKANKDRQAMVQEFIQVQQTVLFDRAAREKDPSLLGRYAELEKGIARLLAEENEALAEAGRIGNEARAVFNDKLAYDVRQAVFSRVEARRQRRLPWHYRGI